jgi:hypothetical protein
MIPLMLVIPLRSRIINVMAVALADTATSAGRWLPVN